MQKNNNFRHGRGHGRATNDLGNFSSAYRQYSHPPRQFNNGQSSKLLYIPTFNDIATQLSQHDIYLSSFEELLSRSTAQVIFNVIHIVYVLKIPQLSQNIYEYDYIDSTIKNQKRIMIVQNVLLKNDTHVFELTQPYVEQSDYYLCDITSLSITIDCIQQLIRGQHSNCNFEKENKRWNYIYKRRISRYNFKLQ